MCEKSKEKRYALEVYCDEMTFLISLSYIEFILPYDKIVCTDADTVQYQGRELSCFYLKEILSGSMRDSAAYAILLQHEDIQVFLFVQNVCGLQELPDRCLKLPAYLKQRIPYIQGCYMLNQNRLAYQLDIITLLKQHNHDQKGERI